MKAIMDLIGNIKNIESKLGRRPPNQADSKHAFKNSRHAVENNDEEKHRPAENNHLPADDESQLGRNIDTTA